MILTRLIPAIMALFRALPASGVARSLSILGILVSQSNALIAYSAPIAISTDDRLIWAVNPHDNTVSVIRPDTNEILAEYRVGEHPCAVAITPDKRWVYVANAGDNSVTVIQILRGAWSGFSAFVDASVGLTDQSLA